MATEGVQLPAAECVQYRNYLASIPQLCTLVALVETVRPPQLARLMLDPLDDSAALEGRGRNDLTGADRCGDGNTNDEADD